ncbi:hypothetical protein MJO29_015674 [Puccinia striiformis f. sp. tritici]|nr:hypothetical protein MJO29_015674 [Puccinia striiformis f. sp. tritici]
MSHPTNTSINTKNPINPPDDTKGTINNSGVTVSPAVWKQLQNLLAMHPGPSPSTTSNLDQSYPSENPFDSSNPIEDEDTNDNSNSGSNSKEFLPDDILESLNVTDYRDGHQKKAACFVDQDLKSLETTDSASDLPTLITDPQSYDFTTGEPMEPPRVTRFLTKDDLLRFCQLWAKTHGYAVCNSHSAAEKNVYIRCDRGGIYEGKKTNQSGRKTASSKTDCPFKLKGSIPTSKNITNKTWTLEVQEGTHNHDPSPGASSHAAHRKLQPDQVLELRCLFKSNIKPAQMLLQLRTSDDQTLATNKTITNMLQKFRREDLDGKTPIEALVYVLKETNWSWEVKVNDSGQIQNLFFAHPGSIHLAWINHHVALLDATYKTNRYKIPLLHVIGQAASNRSLSIAFCFLTYEDDDNYLWAVQVLKKLIWKPDRIPKVFITDRDTALRNALADVFPHSQANLCTWHINKNITTNCRKYFPSIEPPAKSGTKRKAAKKSVDGKLEKDKPVDPWKQFMGLWNWVTYAKSPELYTKRFQNLKVFLSTRPAVLAYLKKNIIPVKKLFVVAWACQYPHLWNLNTSRVESGHAHLKTFVTSSTGDLLSVFQALGHAVDAQILAVHESIGKDTIKTLVHVPKCFIPLLGEISSFTIKEAMDQFDQLKNNFNPMEPCSQTLTTGVGIPCAHQIAEILESGSTLTPDDFHSQWSLKYNPEFTHEEEPEIDLDHEIRKLTIATHTVVALQAPAVKEKNTKGRPNSKKQAAKSTKRLPLAFEVAEADFKKAESSKKRAAKSSAPHKSKRSKKTKDDEVLSHTDLTDEESDVEGSVDYELKDKSDGNESENEENNESENEENNESENEQNNENTNKQENEEAKKNKNIKEEENKKIQEDSNKNKEDDDNKTLSNGEKVEYLCQIPDHLHPFIRQVFNPIGDSNCGFRCVAKALGYEDNGWFRVQQEMVKEIVGNKELYMKLQGGEQELKRIVEGLQVKSKKTKIDPSKWLNKMAHGQVLANVYTIPVVFLSLVACNTFLPLKTGPHESSNTAPLYLIHVNGNHWVLATVEAINSVKPIPPAVSATKSTSKNAKGWTAFIKKGVNLYKKGENKKKF